MAFSSLFYFGLYVGVSVVVGQESEKVLDLDVSMKSCTSCSRDLPHEICYRNHTGSSGSMEVKGIVTNCVELCGGVLKGAGSCKVVEAAKDFAAMDKTIHEKIFIPKYKMRNSFLKLSFGILYRIDTTKTIKNILAK